VHRPAGWRCEVKELERVGVRRNSEQDNKEKCAKNRAEHSGFLTCERGDKNNNSGGRGGETISDFAGFSWWIAAFGM